MAQLVKVLTGWARQLVPCLGSPVQSQAGSLHLEVPPAHCPVATSVERLGTSLHKKGKCVVNWEGTLRCPVSPV